MSRALPVFLKNRDIPDASNFDSRPSVLEVCLSAERVSGSDTIVGAQQIRGLWRIYPATEEARRLLLLKGMKLRGVSVNVHANNPFLLRDDSGMERPSTKVWVDDLPISVADSEVEHALKKLGCELRSDIKMERARDKDHKLTRFLTGRRFVFISVPDKPLDRSLQINIFSAKLFHKEQKLVNKPVTCSVCLLEGHHRSVCPNELVCIACKGKGHKRGDPACQAVIPDKDSNSTQPKEKDQQADAPKTVKSNKASNPNKRDISRGRFRQSKIDSSVRLDSQRSRSHTPKRQRVRDSPVESSKQPRLTRTDQTRPDDIVDEGEDHNDYDSLNGDKETSEWY